MHIPIANYKKWVGIRSYTFNHTIRSCNSLDSMFMTTERSCSMVRFRKKNSKSSGEEAEHVNIFTQQLDGEEGKGTFFSGERLLFSKTTTGLLQLGLQRKE